MRRIFPLRTCNDPSKHPRACLQYHIGRCLGPCLADFDKHEEYAQTVKDAALFLEGKVDAVVKRLKDRMFAASENLEFERAAELRDQVAAVERIVAKQKIISRDLTDQDAIAFARGRDEACVQVFFVRQGKLVERDQFILTGTDDMTDGEIIAAFVQQHYNQTDFVPKEILVAAEPENVELLEEWLSGLRGGKVVVRRPQRGEKRDLVEMVAKNAEEGLAERTREREKELAATEGALRELQQYLGLPHLPYRIECFDISHSQGSEVVAGMVVFEGGKPKTSDYRRFKMTRDVNNDFANMAEAVLRRFKRGLAEREALAAAVGGVAGAAGEVGGAGAANDGAVGATGWKAGEAPKFAIFPDLLIIDGGKGQLHYARTVMRELGVDHIPTFGLAKEEEILFREGEGEGIVLPRQSQALFLLQRVRDETHRVAITYHRTLHRKAATRSRSKVPSPAATTRPVSPPVSSRWPSTRLAKEREKASVTIPVKITPKERRTATQLSNPPRAAASAVASASPTAMGSPASSTRMAEA
jgi:excinuclease ABC subunit C